MSERDTRSIYLIILVHQAFFMSRRHLNREDLRLKIQQSHHSDHHNCTITIYKHTIKHIETLQYYPIRIDRYLEFIYHIEINHNLPPPKNRDQASYFPMPFPLCSNSRSCSPLFLFFLFFFCRFFFFYPNYHIINYKR